MRPIATNLVWAVGFRGEAQNAVTGTTGAPTATFRPTDEGALVAADGTPIWLPLEDKSGGPPLACSTF
jgi:hypothetical protein